jgi:outer membrane protein assembly factor BamB
MKYDVQTAMLSLIFGVIAAFMLACTRATNEGELADRQGARGNTVEAFTVGVGSHDWPQWGGASSRNNTPDAKDIVTEWAIGEFDTGVWKPEGARNMKWVARLGSQSYGNPVVANGQVYVGTNNAAGYVKRYPPNVDLGVLLCFSENDGKFLWQHSSQKLASGSKHDWPEVGVCSSPLVDGNRLWFVNNRCELVCLDTEGFRDGENDGPFKGEANENQDEADVIWVLNMIAELGVSPRNMSSCSVTTAGDILFVCTSNGADDEGNVPAPRAPSFIAVNRRNGKLLWSDNSPGENILRGQWSSPAYTKLADVPQVIFAGGDGWLYSFLASEGDGKSKLLWKFDCNPKGAEWKEGGQGTRNSIVSTPVIHDGLVYIATGQDPELGEGPGTVWCIDPSKRGDVSPTQVFVSPNAKQPLPHRRTKALNTEVREVELASPNSAAIWKYTGSDLNANGKIDFDEQMHRCTGTVAIKNDLLVVADLNGLVHCVDAKRGSACWTHDLLSPVWGSPLIVEGKVYVGDTDGNVTIFELSRQKRILATRSMGESLYSSPIVANGALLIATRSHLFSIAAKR